MNIYLFFANGVFLYAFKFRVSAYNQLYSNLFDNDLVLIKSYSQFTRIIRSRHSYNFTSSQGVCYLIKEVPLIQQRNV